MANNEKISNIKRLRQILNAFAKHGLGHLLKISGLDTYVSFGKRVFMMKEDEEKITYTYPQRMVMVFEELGPTFIKLGQLLSSRKDQIPKEYIVEFEKLQDNTTPVSFEKIDMVFESEFGQSTIDTFDYIDKIPIASGSIGQVHAARLKTGEEVVVKIRKPGIEHIINADMKILYFIANQLKNFVTNENDMLDPVEIIKLFEKVTRNELDFAMEGKNIERFQHNFRDNPEVHFPRVYWQYSSLRVLVMERIYGIPIGNVKSLREKGHDLNKIAVNLFNTTLKQMFIDAFFHADPHPGNFIIMENGVLGIIDCGMVRFMDDTFMNAFVDCFGGIFLHDYDMVVRGYMNVGTISKNIDQDAFKNDIRNFVEHYMDISFNTISIGTLFDDAIDIGVRNKMKIPAAMLFTTRALISVEGTIRKLDSGFDFMHHSTNFAKNLVVKKKFEPKKVLADMYTFISSMIDLFQSLPKQSSKILSIIEDQKLSITIDIKGFELFNKNIKNIAASVALGVISAGLGVASSIVIQAKIEPLAYGVSGLGLFGYTMAVVLALWVIFLISRRIK
ncbi:AarF/ABC1/UbiB kinase family protein [Candidatus Poribacteria bacterium]|nr:AarF/ABC1/UbiB kinase family protein [Candidatus Poribacteria bacterium]